MQKPLEKPNTDANSEMPISNNIARISSEKNISLNNYLQKDSLLSNLQSTDGESGFEDGTSENITNISDSDLITVHKSEYEAIKNRVSALEEDLKLLTTVHSVQFAYEKALEESEKLNENTPDLARRLSKELKIRLSSENKVVRSPSARKIGSFRRRSKESICKKSEQKGSLKRGRPNTVLTGLPSPRLRTLSNENISTTKPVCMVTRSSTFHSAKEDWESGEAFFAKEHLLRKLSPAVQGRPSLAEIRCQNAGMVLEKAKLFNSMNESKEARVKMPRRQSIRIENLRRFNEADKNTKKMLTRTRSLGSDKKLKNSSPGLMTESPIQSKSHGREMGQEFVTTPKTQKIQTPSHGNRRETPSIKKSLTVRSPRNFAKTPLSQMRSANRIRNTPMKVLAETGNTPRQHLRRSPRFSNRSFNTPLKHKE